MAHPHVSAEEMKSTEIRALPEVAPLCPRHGGRGGQGGGGPEILHPTELTLWGWLWP